MPIPLESLRYKFLQRISTVDSAFDRHVLNRSTVFRLDQSALQEGLLSNLWQSWCTFCRSLTIASTVGAESVSGAITTSPYSTLSESEIMFVANKLSKQRPIGNIRPLVGSYLEPTWGDIRKLHLIISGLQPSNLANIRTGLAGASRIPDLQLCRNSCAHINKDTLDDVKQASVRYRSSKLKHPSDMMFWEDPNTRNFLWKTWKEDMELVAIFAIR